jgi:hypothetical protein
LPVVGTDLNKITNSAGNLYTDDLFNVWLPGSKGFDKYKPAFEGIGGNCVRSRELCRNLCSKGYLSIINPSGADVLVEFQRGGRTGGGRFINVVLDDEEARSSKLLEAKTLKKNSIRNFKFMNIV